MVSRQATKPSNGQADFWKSGSLADSVNDDAMEWAKLEFNPEEAEGEEGESEKRPGPSEVKGKLGVRRQLFRHEDGHCRLEKDWATWDHKVAKEVIRSLVATEYRMFLSSLFRINLMKSNARHCGEQLKGQDAVGRHEGRPGKVPCCRPAAEELCLGGS